MLSLNISLGYYEMLWAPDTSLSNHTRLSHDSRSDFEWEKLQTLTERTAKVFCHLLRWIWEWTHHSVHEHKEREPRLLRCSQRPCGSFQKPPPKALPNTRHNQMWSALFTSWNVERDRYNFFSDRYNFFWCRNARRYNFFSPERELGTREKKSFQMGWTCRILEYYPG